MHKYAYCVIIVSSVIVDQPCKLGCSGLSFCTNFNNRPTELFRSCTVEADHAAQMGFNSWKNGVIHLPQMTIPVKGQRLMYGVGNKLYELKSLSSFEIRMTNIHTFWYLFASLCVYVSVCLSICPSLWDLKPLGDLRIWYDHWGICGNDNEKEGGGVWGYDRWDDKTSVLGNALPQLHIPHYL